MIELNLTQLNDLRIELEDLLQEICDSFNNLECEYKPRKIRNATTEEIQEDRKRLITYLRNLDKNDKEGRKVLSKSIQRQNRALVWLKADDKKKKEILLDAQKALQRLSDMSLE